MVTVRFGEIVADNRHQDTETYQFIYEQIESVPHLEALLLLWNSRPQPWTLENLASRLYLPEDAATVLLQELIRRNLVVAEAGPPPGYRYASESAEQDERIASVDALYRREVVRISTMIHSKPSSSVREFAKAFRFTKGLS